MDFKTGYFHALDKNAENNELVPPAQLGIPTHPGKDQLEGLKGRIKLGAKNVELGFFGKGKGSLQQGNTTPGLYGKDERAAMKELAKVNKINMSVHASANVQGFAGWTGRGFSEHDREKNIDEVKRAIDFAADTTEGGAVVMHMGEFPRPLTDIPDKIDKGKLQYYPSEADESTVYLVDKKTGELIGGLKKNQKVDVPVYVKGKLQTTKARLGATKEPITVPKTTPWTWSTFQEKAEENKKLLEKSSKVDEHGNKFALDENSDQVFDKDTNPGFLMYKATRKERQEEALGWATHHGRQYEDHKREYERLKVEIEAAKKSPALKGEIHSLQEQQDRHLHDMEYYRGSSSGKMSEYWTIQDQLERATPIEEFGSEKTFDSIARLGVFAMSKTKDKKLDKPLFAAPENIWAETGYGSHPDELKDIIVKSRKRFVEVLTKPELKTPHGMRKNYLYNKQIGKSEAESLAKNHIKATFDTGHAYTWKKHFQGKDKDFKKWLIGKVKDLQKAGVIGHVHMSDNFGYEDEHGTLGEGRSPVKEFVSELRKGGYKGTMIAEPAHNDYKALLGAWKALHSPIYKIDHTSRAWTDIEHGYFGRTFSPNYTFRSYLPIGGDKAPLTWGEVPLE